MGETHRNYEGKYAITPGVERRVGLPEEPLQWSKPESQQPAQCPFKKNNLFPCPFNL